MNYIAHRVNTVKSLLELPTSFGVEIDLRDYETRIVLEHDPFSDGEDFEDYLKHYNHGTMILNIKSERIEHRVLDLVKKYNIKNYFLLDSSFPMIYLLSQMGEKNIALRFSEYEGLDTILAMKGKVDWVWVDSFSKLPINQDNFKLIKEAGFKLCLVSPELQGRPEDIEEYKIYLSKNKIIFDAICTKLHNIERWEDSCNLFL